MFDHIESAIIPQTERAFVAYVANEENAEDCMTAAYCALATSTVYSNPTEIGAHNVA